MSLAITHQIPYFLRMSVIEYWTSACHNQVFPLQQQHRVQKNTHIKMNYTCCTALLNELFHCLTAKWAPLVTSNRLFTSEPKPMLTLTLVLQCLHFYQVSCWWDLWGLSNFLLGWYKDILMKRIRSVTSFNSCQDILMSYNCWWLNCTISTYWLNKIYIRVHMLVHSDI